MRNHCLLWLSITSVLTLGSPAFAAIDGISRLITGGGGSPTPIGRSGGSTSNPGRGESTGSGGGSRLNIGNGTVVNPGDSPATGGGFAPGGGMGQITRPGPDGMPERP